jgi:hypothetical protein
VITHGERPPQLYLGSGTHLSSGPVSLTTDAPAGASVWPDGTGWRCSSSASVRVTIPFAAPVGATGVDGLAVECDGRACPATLRLAPGGTVSAELNLPAGYDRAVTLVARQSK